MTETTQLSGKIKHKCSKTMLLTPQELFELDRCIESLRASGSFTEDEKRAVTENDFSRWETLSCGLRTWIAEKHYAEFLAVPTVPVDEAYLESSVFRAVARKMGARPGVPSCAQRTHPRRPPPQSEHGRRLRALRAEDERLSDGARAHPECGKRYAACAC